MGTERSVNIVDKMLLDLKVSEKESEPIKKLTTFEKESEPIKKLTIFQKFKSKIKVIFLKIKRRLK